MKKDDTKIAPKTVRTADRSLKCFKVPRVYYCIVEEKNFVPKSYWVDRQQTERVKKLRKSVSSQHVPLNGQERMDSLSVICKFRPQLF
jgi:hypothetical protein